MQQWTEQKVKGKCESVLPQRSRFLLSAPSALQGCLVLLLVLQPHTQANMFILQRSPTAFLTFLFLSISLATASVIPRQSTEDAPTPQVQDLLNLAKGLHNPREGGDDNATFPSIDLSTPYTVPQNTLDKILRSTGITLKRTGFLYGPPVAGGPYYPTGLLGIARIATDLLELQPDILPQILSAAVDDADAAIGVGEVSFTLTFGRGGG